MSYSRDVLVSDIPANTLAQLEQQDFFPVGNVEELTKALRRKLEAPKASRTYDLTPYDWDTIAHQTIALYTTLL